MAEGAADESLGDPPLVDQAVDGGDEPLLAARETKSLYVCICVYVYIYIYI